jgi:NitT/TauT family transport system substrate-binding protein
MKRALVLAASAVLLAAAPAKADDRIRILSPTWSGYAPVFVAGDLGYFKAAGLDVDLKFDDERADVMAAMTRKDIEMEMRTTGEYQGRPRTAETPGVIIGTIDESLGGDGVIAEGSIKRVADLRGKTVASELNIPARLLLQLELKKAGMSLKDLTLKEIATGDTVAVFADPSITAVATYEPYLSQAMKTNSARSPVEIVSSKSYPGYITDVFIVRQDDLKANPDKYKRFLVAVYKAITYFKTNRTEFIKLAAPHYKLSPADFAASIDNTLIYTDLGESQKLMGSPTTPGTLRGIFDTLMQLNLENGAASTKLSADGSIDAAIIKTLTDKDLK